MHDHALPADLDGHPALAARRNLKPLHGVALAGLLLVVSSAPTCDGPQPVPATPPPAMELTCPPYCEAVADLVEGHRIRVTCECS